MARRARQLLAGRLYHVLLRGNNGQAVFVDDEDRLACRRILTEACRQHGVSLHAWLLLPARVHLLVTPRQAEGLGQVMQVLGRQYVRLFNRRHLRTGTLWEGRFRSSLIEAPRFALVCQQYLESLPVRLGLVERPEDFHWSSCRYHLGLTQDSGVHPLAAYWALGNTPFEREAAWRARLSGAEGERALADLEAVLRYRSLARAWDYGHPVATEGWLRALELAHGQRLQIQAVGRPRRKASS